jgi:hypothetical protein
VQYVKRCIAVLATAQPYSDGFVPFYTVMFPDGQLYLALNIFNKVLFAQMHAGIFLEYDRILAAFVAFEYRGFHQPLQRSISINIVCPCRTK